MKNSQTFIGILVCLAMLCSCTQTKSPYDLSNFGLVPDRKGNASPLMAKALEQIAVSHTGNDTITIVLPPGRYDFYPEGAAQKEYFISNHDQDNPKLVGLPFENMKNIVFDGQGSELIFHGRMLPVSLVNSENCTLKNFSIDFENPHIAQVKVLENDAETGTITYEVAPWVQYEIRDSALIVKGEGWEHSPAWGIAFEGDTKRLVYRTSDIAVGSKGVSEVSPRVVKSTKWKNEKLIPGTVVAMRGYGRPTPGIFVSYDTNTTLENIQVHYAEGMGLLAQMSENITLDKFSVCLRGDSDPRYFTTQADATHFSGCKGKIISVGGLYEGMMDDAINVHGTYLKVQKRVDDKTLVGEYMHGQSYGFEWGFSGDAVQFIDSKTMEILGDQNKVVAIKSVDKPSAHGAKQFEIVFEKAIDPAISEAGTFGIENLEWTPEVYFADNTIRNNRARGSLFSTPKKTVVEKNIFDHTSGTAILLCGDCNGWFETGACHDVLIRDNKFINSLTNMFQFTNAVISIYPEIPDLKDQKKYFHSGIVIENNEFETFDAPILYAKSVDGLVFRNNVIKQNNQYPAFHWNNHRFFFQRVTNYDIKDNQFDGGLDEKKDLKVEN
ncbi:alpha-1,3-galactosidase B [Parabacteroides sp. TM07-1AC]|uniref:alpha-1,3-galactosidase-related protein n=1 Tax=Parabacteroides sp. TM07-1AC TaxID=2292363 RepID=UPI000EFF822D|nr:right-handed parallel beta-helix repeat-containing protein [Parabacteroides sp. TM07-1AC]RHU26175.1 alpha-1,3-galactosidase B [Parabacteroides sp. TM07-1AC]